MCGEPTPRPLCENASYKGTDGSDYQHHREGDTVAPHSSARDREGQEEDKGAYQGTLCVELGRIDARTEKDEDKDEHQGNDKQRQNDERVDPESLGHFHTGLFLSQQGAPSFYHSLGCLSSAA
jgi:hypothetical protein